MNNLDEFFLTEDFTGGDDLVEVDIHETAAGTVAIPARTGKNSRRPIDPGFALGWDEWNVDAPTVRWRRRGIVEAWAPNQASVWVIPDDRRAGEGMYVVVRDVFADAAKKAEKDGEREKTPYRAVGGPGDFRSTPQWQSPRMLLPRPLLRVDRMFNGAGDVLSDLLWLHTDGECGFPSPMAGMDERIERGTAAPVEDCYVFEGALHPLSVRPMTPRGEWVPTCLRCMNAELPD